ncbi:alcohol dehydrogenase catalytic domain-containing protein [Candidatus Methanodesulfokora washburnensis]|uniref:Alcohol dehydrogenase n=1 Tax=Candidatus Methanodesulfokora washburnensis TaxID=2478471 RepID=A0A3R9PF47_9CREN|nr:alcohol dehydrogenase catalytic domain-containing protein [Candidatus Methanodesulfokores washburnensis]RSN74667.1 alcohol dehydrogenase [Candidatus Methanodesulfokores washburnensis]
MRALVLHGPRDLRLENIRDEEPQAGWVKLKVRYVGICGTDKAVYSGSYKLKKLPIVLGHEVSGEVVEVGEGVSKDLLGSRVTTEINVSCKSCWYCRNGMPEHCPQRETIGLSINGGMAEHLLTRSDLLHGIDELSWQQGAFVEPLAAVLEAAVIKKPDPQSNIAIIGVGTIGLLSIQVMRLFDPATIVAIVREGSPKAKLAKSFGAHTLTYEEALEFVKREKLGFDYVIEATGSPDGLDKALKLVRPRGVIVAKSTHGGSVSLDYTDLVVREISIIGSRCGPFNWAIELLKSGCVRIDDLISSTYKLERGNEAFRRSFERDQVKILLEVT